MEIRGPKLTPPAAPATAVVGSAAQAAAPAMAGDQLAVSPGEQQAHFKALEALALPKKPMLMALPGQRDAWVKQAASALAAAYPHYAALVASGAGAPPRMQAAMDRLVSLSGQVAAVDKKNVRQEVLRGVLRDESAVLRRGLELTPKPVRAAGQSAEDYRAAVNTWAEGQRGEIAAARGAVERIKAAEGLLQTELFAGYSGHQLDKAEAQLQQQAREVGVLEGLGAMVKLGQAVAEVVAQEQARRHSR